MVTKITRAIHFDAGHRVLGHESKCANLHGHRYIAEITVSTPKLDGLGRIVDFSVIKDTLGSWIDLHWDHNVLLHPSDPLLQIDRKAFGGNKPPYIMPGENEKANPTAENMARVLYNVAKEMFPTYLHIENVRIYETPNCWSDYADQ